MFWWIVVLCVFVWVGYLIYTGVDFHSDSSDSESRGVSDSGSIPRMEVDELLELLRVRCDYFVTKKRVYIAIGRGLLETKDLYVDLFNGSPQGLSNKDLYSLRKIQISNLMVKNNKGKYHIGGSDYLDDYSVRGCGELRVSMITNYLMDFEEGNCYISNFEGCVGLWIKEENENWSLFDKYRDFIEDPKEIKSWIEDGGLSKVVNEGIAKAIKIQNAVKELGDLNLTEVSRGAFADYRGITYNG